MYFCQTGAPTGWTKSFGLNDQVLRVVSGGTGGGQGGTHSFSSVMAQTVVGGHIVTTPETTAHTHDQGNPAGPLWGDYVSIPNNVISNAFPTVIANLTGASTTTAATGGGASHNHTIMLDIQYVDLICGINN